MSTTETLSFLRNRLESYFGPEVTIKQHGSRNTLATIEILNKRTVTVRIVESRNHLSSFKGKAILSLDTCPMTRVGWWSNVSTNDVSCILFIMKADGPTLPIRCAVIPSDFLQRIARTKDLISDLYIDVNSNGEAWLSRISNWHLSKKERCVIAQDTKLIKRFERAVLLTDNLEKWELIVS